MMSLDELLVLHRRLWRVVWFVSAPPLLQLLPCAAASLVFFVNDNRYQLAIIGPYTGNSLAKDYRRLAHELEPHKDFGCFHSDPPYPGEKDQRDPVFRTLQEADGEVLGRWAVAGPDIRQLTWWFDDLDLAVLRPGMALDSEYIEIASSLDTWDMDNIQEYCQMQTHSEQYGLPPLPPIQVSDSLRTLLLDNAKRMDAAVKKYEAERTRPLIFFCLWIGYCAFGLLSIIYVGYLGMKLRRNAMLFIAVCHAMGQGNRPWRDFIGRGNRPFFDDWEPEGGRLATESEQLDEPKGDDGSKV